MTLNDYKISNDIERCASLWAYCQNYFSVGLCNNFAARLLLYFPFFQRTLNMSLRYLAKLLLRVLYLPASQCSGAPRLRDNQPCGMGDTRFHFTSAFISPDLWILWAGNRWLGRVNIIINSLYTFGLITTRRVCIALTMLSQDVCSSVYLSVTRWHSVDIAEHILKKIFYRQWWTPPF